MSQSPLVSIIITNFNYGAFVIDAVESALTQRYALTEVIVVDDGSTDDSRMKLDQYRDRVQLLFEANAGQAAAMNRGFAQSRGDLILFLDADDSLEPEAVDQAVTAYREGDSKLQFALRGVDTDGRDLGFRFPGAPMVSGDLRALTAQTGGYPSPPTSGNLFTRVMLDQVMPIPEQEWRRWPDTYLILSAPFHGNVRSINGCLGRFRLHGNNSWVTDQVDAERLRSYLECDRAKEELTRRYTRDPRASLWRSVDHLQARLASLRLDPGAHPYPEDRTGRVVWAGFTAALAHPTSTTSKRLLFALWFLTVGVLPPRSARRAIELGYAPGKRPEWLKRMLRGSSAS